MSQQPMRRQDYERRPPPKPSKIDCEERTVLPGSIKAVTVVSVNKDDERQVAVIFNAQGIPCDVAAVCMSAEGVDHLIESLIACRNAVWPR